MSENLSTANENLNAFIHDNDRGNGKYVGGVVSKDIDDAMTSLLYRAQDKAVVANGLSSWATIKNTQRGDITEITYKFIDGDGKNIISFNDVARETFRQSAKQWAEVANVKYIEITGNKKADIDVYVNKGMSAAGGGSFPGSGENSQDFVRVNFQPTDSNYSHQLVTHELGHSLGLSHSFTLGNYVENTNNYSVMSYSTAPDLAQGDYSAWPIGPQIDDIAAVQKLYGANTTTRSDDTVYGFNSNTGERELSFSNEVKELKLPFSIWDTGGNDTLDFSGFSQNQRIDLNEGKMSDVGGHKANVGIAIGTIIENAIGGNGNDIIIGNASDNKIDGGNGDDIIYGGVGSDFLTGGQGSDTFVYRASSDSILSGLGKDANSGGIKDLSEVISINDLSGRYDTIFDFNSGEDKIDLSYLSKNGQFDFSLVEHFSGKAGEIELQYFSESNTTLLAANINNTQTVGADFAIKIIGHVDYVNDILV
ncbi:M10 family metallopeptidase C-terminal domain-containing protein [Serratia marcescens]|uniref:M10 family metallopeptidase C-terminal domain-containing protein n=1 Tax=Serratia nevei TaxID=2703794 RepID=UPI0018D92A75|nr:M10 family metallopeptidase C-terminal domain-containing protein [Serratia marcescens]MBH2799316.1 M10 family metallopeptidase C-terminal domain-containing protein [Serratia marcescens]MBH2808942.1 M10 family metallopeptidase C-terminal domain-containing protein [Serratia marcescens]MBH2961983.1 M10 family metallopeptidase C-terminal domain-containing protein [Serratia marcescens]MBN5236886.1 M10 family metallopeptidase C-terminal domain-containing protein [Serratia marcescens]